MVEKFKGIVTDVTHHSDKHDVVTLFTRSRGRISFLSNTGGKTGKIKNARLFPLSAIEGDFNFRPNASLQRLGPFSPIAIWNGIYFNPIKQITSLFLSEFLNKLLLTTMPDENLWDYIFDSLRLFNSTDKGINDFHIVFLTSLLPFLGIQPDISSYSPGNILDLEAGIFRDAFHLSKRCLSPEESEFASKLLRIDFRNYGALKLNAGLRNRILSRLLEYYGIHFPGTSNLKSLDVIIDLFHS